MLLYAWNEEPSDAEIPPDEDSLPSLERHAGPVHMVVLPRQDATPDDPRVRLDPPDAELLPALRHWCQELELTEAAAFLRRVTRDSPPPRPGIGAPLWLMVPTSRRRTGVLDRASSYHLERDPDIVAVVRALERERFGTGSAEVYARLAQIVERDLWP